MTYSRWERLHFRLFKRWPQRVVDRRLAALKGPPTPSDLLNAYVEFYGIEPDDQERTVDYCGVLVTFKTAVALESDKMLYGNAFVTKDGRRIPPDEVTAEGSA